MGNGPSNRTLLHVRVQPKASRNSISLDAEGKIRVALTAPPVDGEANEALRALMAKSLHVSKRSISLVSGEKSRDKTLSFASISEPELRRRIEAVISD